MSTFSKHKKGKEEVTLVQDYQVYIDLGGRAVAFTEDLAIENDTNLDFVMTLSGAADVKFDYQVEADGACEIRLYENPTVTAATGTAVTAYNRNRKKAANVIAATFLKNPTITAVGTQIGRTRIFGTSGISSTKSGGTAVSISERVAKTGKYLVRVTGKTTPATIKASVQFDVSDSTYNG